MFRNPQAGTMLLICCALLAPVLYPLSYLALADHRTFYPCMQGMNCEPWVFRYPQYRIGGDSAACFFGPMERFDRWYRPDYWEWREPILPAVSWSVAVQRAKEINQSLEIGHPSDDNRR